jgi:hypothetical protein
MPSLTRFPISAALTFDALVAGPPGAALVPASAILPPTRRRSASAN